MSLPGGQECPVFEEELVFHARRPYPPVAEKYTAGAYAAPGAAYAGAPAPTSAEEARSALDADGAAVKQLRIIAWGDAK